MKIKVGRPNREEDAERVAAVRRLIGPETAFMVDANLSMSVDQAIAAAQAFLPYDMLWFGEPVIPDDFRGHATIAERKGVPLAMGKTCTPSTSLNLRSGMHNFHTFNPMRRIAAE